MLVIEPYSKVRLSITVIQVSNKPRHFDSSCLVLEQRGHRQAVHMACTDSVQHIRQHCRAAEAEGP